MPKIKTDPGGIGKARSTAAWCWPVSHDWLDQWRGQISVQMNQEVTTWLDSFAESDCDRRATLWCHKKHAKKYMIMSNHLNANWEHVMNNDRLVASHHASVRLLSAQPDSERQLQLWCVYMYHTSVSKWILHCTVPQRCLSSILSLFLIHYWMYVKK